MLGIVFFLRRVEYSIGDGIIIGGETPAKMKYACGKNAIVGFVILLFSLMMFISVGANKVGDTVFLAGLIISAGVPIYYNYIARRCMWALDGECSRYLKRESEICGFVVRTSRGDIPVVGERNIPIKGLRVRVFLKMRRLPFKEVAISLVYSYERIEKPQRSRMKI